MITKITYITYQTFPSEKANTIQTIENLKHLNRQGLEVDLIYPLREKNSTNDISVINNYYQYENQINIKARKHYLPFGKSKYLEKYTYLISHILWSYWITKNYKIEHGSYVFTRSDWVFYFLSRKNIPVVFECHQLTSLRRTLMKNSIKKIRSKIIFLNDYLATDSDLDVVNDTKKIAVIHNGVDTDNFNTPLKKSAKNTMVFVGNLLRFNKSRGVEFVLQAMKKDEFPEDMSFKLIGGPDEEVGRLKDYISELQLNNKVEFFGRLSRSETIIEMRNSNFGLLLNSDEDKHSISHTSPLKYFEYLYAGLGVIAVDYPSHRSLPYSKNISFFTNEDSRSFIEALKDVSNKNTLNKADLESLSLENRAKKIIKFLST
jgi:glycosyltransferase involved in cell wall biosynthesis